MSTHTVETHIAIDTWRRRNSAIGDGASHVKYTMDDGISSNPGPSLVATASPMDSFTVSAILLAF